MLPLRQLDSLRIATLVIGGSAADTTDFQRAVADYAPVAHFHLPAAPTLDELSRTFGLSPERIRQIEHQSLRKLQKLAEGEARTLPEGPTALAS